MNALAPLEFEGTINEAWSLHRFVGRLNDRPFRGLPRWSVMCRTYYEAGRITITFHRYYNDNEVHWQVPRRPVVAWLCRRLGLRPFRIVTRRLYHDIDFKELEDIARRSPIGAGPDSP